MPKFERPKKENKLHAIKYENQIPVNILDL